MKDQDKTKSQLIKELEKLHRRISELETLEAEHKLVEEALLESERKYRDLIEQTPDSIVTFDIKGVVTLCNTAAVKFSDHSKDEIIGRHFSKLKFFRAKDIPRYTKLLPSIVRGKVPEPFEVVWCRKDGSSRISEVSFSLIKQKGKVVGFQGIARDITERKKVEEKLRLYSQAVDNSIDGVAIGNLQCNITYVNESFVKMFGYSIKELIGKEIPFIYPEDQLPKLEQALKATMQGSWVGELVGKRKNGELFPMAISSSPIKDEKGNVIAHMANHRDITERKKVEEALRKSEIKYRTLVEHLPAITYTAALDESSTTLYVSPQIKKILGISPEMYKADPDFWVKHLHDEDRERVLGEVIRAHETDKTFISEYRMISVDGRIVWFRDEAVIVRDDKGIPLYLQGVMLDITERKQTEEELKKHHDHLEKLVEKRTAELTRINDQLQADITERKQAEEALRESEERFRTIFETAQDSVFIKDRMYRYIQVNSAMERLFGLPASKLIGRTDEDLFGKEAATHIKEVDSRVLDGEIIEEEHTKSVKGTMFTFHIIKVPLRDSSGEIIGLCGIARDITERKQAEEAIRESEEKYRAAVEQSADNIYLLDTETKRVLETNAALQNLLGYSAEEMRNLTVYDLVAHSKKDINQKIKNITKIKRSFIGERKYRRKDGFIVDVEVSANFITLKGKKVLFVVSRDITKRKRVQEALQESEEKYKTLTENINVGIYRNTVGPKGKFIEVNPAHLKIFGYNSKKEFLKVSVADLYQKPRDRKRFNEKMLRNGFVKDEELQLKKKDGSLFIGSVSTVAVKDKKGEVKYYDGIIEDVTKRKYTEKRLAHMATHDALTELPNRMLFKDRLIHALKHARRKRQKLAVMLLDLDHFKDINDTLGHNVGDQLLCFVGERLTTTLRKGDTVARMGGDEFMLLLPETIKVEDVTKIAKKIMRAIRKPFVCDHCELRITTSLGISVYPDDGGDADTLMKNADIAMYHAKDVGRNNSQRYNREMNARKIQVT